MVNLRKVLRSHSHTDKNIDVDIATDIDINTRMFTLEQYRETADYIRANTRYTPTIALVLGSGLSPLADSITDPDIIEYGDIPNWPTSTVEGHRGRLVLGRLAEKDVLIMQGRTHSYEGVSLQQTTLPVRAMHLLDINTLIVTNAAGGLNPMFNAGEIMLITDHINWVGMAGLHPLKGENYDFFGPRFPDMTFPYDPHLCDLARTVAREQQETIREGVYVFLSGPNFETPAEIRMLHRLGADAVGMSTVPSVTVARHAGMRVLGFSSITNVAHHYPNPDHVTTHDEVMETGKTIVPRLLNLLTGILGRL